MSGARVGSFGLKETMTLTVEVDCLEDRNAHCPLSHLKANSINRSRVEAPEQVSELMSLHSNASAIELSPKDFLPFQKH